MHCVFSVLRLIRWSKIGRQNKLYTDAALLSWLQVKIFTNACTSAKSGEIILIARFSTVVVLQTEASVYMALINVMDLSWSRYLFFHICVNILVRKPFTQL